MAEQYITEEYLYNVANKICSKIDSSFSKKDKAISKIEVGMARPTGSPYTNLRLCLIMTYDNGDVVNLRASDLMGDLDIATDSIVGGIKANPITVLDESYTTEVKIDEDGFLYVPVPEPDVATGSTAGAVKPDGRTLTVSADGTLSVVNGSGAQGSSGQVLSNISELINDVGYVTSSSIPTKNSELANDSGYLTNNDVPIAKNNRFGGIKANTISDGYKVEVKIDDKTGFLYVPELTAATSTKLGGIKADAVGSDSTYKTKIKIGSDNKLYTYTYTAPTNKVAGVIYANKIEKTDANYTDEVKVNSQGYLYVPTIELATAEKIGGIVIDQIDKVTDSDYVIPIKMDEDGFIFAPKLSLADNKDAGLIYANKITSTDTDYTQEVKISDEGYLYVPEFNLATGTKAGLVCANAINDATDTNYQVEVKIDSSGKLYVPKISPATVTQIGGVKPDNSTIRMDDDGTIHAIDQRTIDPSGATVVYVSSLVNDAHYVRDTELPTIDNNTIVVGRDGNWKVSDSFNPENVYTDEEVNNAIDSILN